MPCNFNGKPIVWAKNLSLPDFNYRAGLVVIRLYSLLQPAIVRFRWVRSILRSIAIRFPWLMKTLQRDRSDYYKSLKSLRNRSAIFIDVTHMSNTKLQTGIQRVVGSLYKELSAGLSDVVDVEPIRLVCKEGCWHYRYYDLDSGLEKHETVVPRTGDIFLGLDLNAAVINPINAGLFNDWRERGAIIVSIVHDILPITHSAWWPASVGKVHADWLRAILSVSDSVVSVSKATQDEVQVWSEKEGIDTQHIHFGWFHLGADFSDTNKESGFVGSDVNHELLAKLKSKKTFIMVGTIEPRKGHLQCLEAFERLWMIGQDINLVFVGKEGWMVDQLIAKMKNNSENDSRFYWLHGISDKYLSALYDTSICLIQASLGEGFGLPLIESAHRRLPILARDIPVFREIAGDNIYYFNGESSEDLEKAVSEWLILFENGLHPRSSNMKWNTWRESANSLLAAANLTVVDGKLEALSS